MYKKYQSLKPEIREEVNYFILFLLIGLGLAILCCLQVISFQGKKEYPYFNLAMPLIVLSYGCSLYRSKTYRKFPTSYLNLCKNLWLVLGLPLVFLIFRLIVNKMTSYVFTSGGSYTVIEAYRVLFTKCFRGAQHYTTAGMLLSFMSPLTLDKDGNLILHPSFSKDKGKDPIE